MRSRRLLAMASALIVSLVSLPASAVYVYNMTPYSIWTTYYEWKEAAMGIGGYKIMKAECIPPYTSQPNNTVNYGYQNPYPTDIKLRAEMTDDANCKAKVLCDTTIQPDKVSAQDKTIYWFKLRANWRGCWWELSTDAWQGWYSDKPVIHTPPQPHCVGACRQFIRVGESLKTGEYLQSADGRFYAVQQADGNLCVYEGPADRPGPAKNPLWCHMHTAGGNKFVTVLQDDGNLCTYHEGNYAGGAGLWCSMKLAQGKKFYLIQQGDGNLCVYTGTGPDTPGARGVWCHNSNTVLWPKWAPASDTRW